jgi:hypothetical protein
MSKTQTSANAPVAGADASAQSGAETGKPFWASQTVWSALAVIGASGAGALLAWRARDMEGLAAAITALLGGVNAIVGRFRADLPLR